MAAYRKYRKGQTVLLRARVTEDCSNLLVPGAALVPCIVENFPDGTFVSRAFAPFSEVADFDDIERLRQPVTIDPTTAKR